MTDIKRKILNDLRVELSDEFDRNFQRKAFFDKSWPPRKMNGKGSLLMVTGKPVTARMKKFFWYKYKATRDDAWKWMALMKVGTKITIPQRQFLGDHPEVRKRAEAVVSRNLQRFSQELVKRLV